MAEKDMSPEESVESADFNFDTWSDDIGLSRKVTQILRHEELTTKRALLLVEYRDLRELNIPLGAAKVIAEAVKKWKSDATVTTDAVEPDNDDLTAAGKTLDMLLQSTSVTTPQKEVLNPMNGHMMDPRTVLTMKSTTNKAVHITQFITEKCKRRRMNKNKQFVIKTLSSDTESILLKTDDEHPYLGLYIEEWGAANMRLMNHLLATNCLRREDAEYYLAYTTKIFEFAETYEWNSVLHFDFTYRELQAQHDFKWGTFSPHMELQILVPKQNRKTSPKSDQRFYPDEECRIFKAKGTCPFGSGCRYRHPKMQQKRQQLEEFKGGKNALAGLQV